ncbi:helix-turn-helix transcriptional regulator [Lachnospiraceae bacterium 48-21]
MALLYRNHFPSGINFTKNSFYRDKHYSPESALVPSFVMVSCPCWHFTAYRLSELCNINATYLRQIEGGTKVPSLPVFINICNALKISPDYLLRDALEDSEVSKIRELAELWESTSPGQQEIAVATIRAVLERKKG